MFSCSNTKRRKNALLTRVCYARAMGTIEDSKYFIGNKSVTIVQKEANETRTSTAADDLMNNNVSLQCTCEKIHWRPSRQSDYNTKREQAQATNQTFDIWHFKITWRWMGFNALKVQLYWYSSGVCLLQSAREFTICQGKNHSEVYFWACISGHTFSSGLPTWHNEMADISDNHQKFRK